MPRQIDFLNPPELMKPVGFAHASLTRGGRTLYLSGQVAKDRDGRVVGKGDVAALPDRLARVQSRDTDRLGAVGKGVDPRRALRAADVVEERQHQEGVAVALVEQVVDHLHRGHAGFGGELGHRGLG